MAYWYQVKADLFQTRIKHGLQLYQKYKISDPKKHQFQTPKKHQFQTPKKHRFQPPKKYTTNQ